MVNPIQFIKDFRNEWEEFWYKYSDERIELARERLQVHKLNLEGKCPVNPYTQPESDWFEYVSE